MTGADLDIDRIGLAELILGATGQAVIVLGDGNRVIYANQPAEHFFGVAAETMKRQPLAAFVPFGSPLFGLVDQVRRTSGSVVEYEVDLGHPRVGARPADIHATRLAEDDPRILLQIQERTIAQKMDRQLTHRGAARSVGAMAAILAHEIKNPLAGIRGAAQLIEQNAGEGDRQLTRLICEESDRIRNLVDRMESFADSRPPTFEPVNIHEVLDRVRRVAAASFAKSIRFVETYDPSLPPVPGDRDQLVQVYMNLVKNAADAIADGGSPADGVIGLSTSYRPGVRLSMPGAGPRVSLPLEVTVRDNGPGVPTRSAPICSTLS